MTALVAVAAGFAAGILVVMLAWSKLVQSRAARLSEAWQAGEGRREVLRVVDDRRAGIKVELGTEVARLLPAFPFEPADTRFLGHPAHFVVFAGHTAVKDRRQVGMTEVVFVTLRPEGRDRSDARLLDECLRAGRVRWATLRVDTPSPDLAPSSTPGAASGRDTVEALGKSAPARAAVLRDGRRR